MAYDQWEYFGNQLWFGLKVTTVLLLMLYHFYCGHLVKVFAQSKNVRDHVFYRFFNEIPVFGLVAVLIFVIVRPF